MPSPKVSRSALEAFVREIAETPVHNEEHSEDYHTQQVCMGCGVVSGHYSRIECHSPDCLVNRGRELLGMPLLGGQPVTCPRCGAENYDDHEVWVGTDEEFAVYKTRFDCQVVGDLKMFSEYEAAAKPYARFAPHGCWSCSLDNNRRHMEILGLVFSQAAQGSNRRRDGA